MSVRTHFGPHPEPHPDLGFELGSSSRQQPAHQPSKAARARIKKLRVPPGVVSKLDACPQGWETFEALVHTRGLIGKEDVSALVSMLLAEVSVADIIAWSHLGGLDPAWRLTLIGTPIATVRRIGLHENGLAGYLSMTQAAKRAGMHPDDVHWWHVAGVALLEPPWLNQRLWEPWRACAVHSIGMRNAAIAAAAGLTPDEARDAVAAGNFDVDVLTMLAGLRA